MSIRHAMIAIAVVGSVFILESHIHVVRAEFGIGIGAAEEASRNASAKLNMGISDFHLMLAALDRKDLESAEKFRTRAVEEISSAAAAYKEAASKAGQRPLKPIIQGEDEARDVATFSNMAKIYKSPEPYTEQSVLTTASDIVAKFQIILGSAKLSPLSRNERGQQTLLNQALELQSFLSATTTMLHVG